MGLNLYKWKAEHKSKLLLIRPVEQYRGESSGSTVILTFSGLRAHLLSRCVNFFVLFSDAYYLTSWICLLRNTCEKHIYI